MTLPILAPQLATWFRKAFDMRERRGTSLADVTTFLNTKGLKAAEVTAITTTLTAD